MKVYRSLAEFNTLECAVATTGTFDGVHLGHQKILNQLVQTAKKVGGESVLLTFDPHPRVVLQPDVELKLLSSIEEKIELLEKSGLDHLIIHPFSKEFSRTPSLEFVREILVNTIGVKHLVIGYDHHFGRNREGSFEHLKEFGPIAIRKYCARRGQASAKSVGIRPGTWGPERSTDSSPPGSSPPSRRRWDR